jgi:type IV pilus assembly protein PilV
MHLIHARQRGFTLIEVLIAVIVLAIGFLGMASLQVTATRLNQRAHQRSQATLLAEDLLDRMRANRDAALAAPSAYALALATPDTCAETSLTGTLAERDLRAWRVSLACHLPQGTGSVTLAGATATIRVQWDDSRGQQPLVELVMESGL